MTKTNLTTLLLLSTAIVSLSVFPVAAQQAQGEKSEFEKLKEDVEGAQTGEEKEITLSKDVVFSDNSSLTVGKENEPKNVKIVVKGDGKSLKGRDTGTQPEKKGTNSTAFTVKKGSRLTLKNVNITNFDADAAGYVWAGAIQNFGTVVLVADEGEKVEFKNNTSDKRRGAGGDITMLDGELYILGQGGTISFSSGITGSNGTGKIYHGCAENGDSEICKDAKSNTSKLILGGENGGFGGTFDNYSGDVEVQSGASFFGGKSTFKSGTLKWNTGKELGYNAHLNLENGSKLEVGDKTNDAKLTLTGSNSNINENVEVTVNGSEVSGKNGSTLTLSGKTQTLKKGVKGSGTLNLQNTDLTLNSKGFDNGLKLSSSGSTLKLQNITEENDSNTLGVLTSSLNNLNSLHLILQTFSGKNKDALKIDGTHIADLLLDTGTNNLEDVTIENSGKMTNNGSSTLGSITNGGTIDNNGTLTATAITNNADINNHGTIKATTFDNNNKTKFTGDGSSSLDVDTLKNNGEIDVSQSTGTFHVKSFTNGENDQYTESKIKGQNLSVDVWQSNHGTIDLSGDLTVSDPSAEKAANPVETANPVENNGSITAQNLTVHNVKIDNKKGHTIDVKGKAHTAEIDNQGTFTIGGELDAHGNVKNGNGEADAENAKLTFAGGTIDGDVTNSGTISTTGGTTTVSGTTTSNNGSWENKGDLTFAGTVSGSGKFDNSGTLNLNGDSSGFTGAFTQTSGTTTVNNGGKMFKGTNTINGGTLDVTQDKLDYKVSLGNNAKWKHTTNTEVTDNITKDTLNFTGTGAEAIFTGSSAGSSNYTLSSEVTKENNRVVFEGAKLALQDGTDFKNVTLKNSTLDLHEENLETKNYTFSDFKTEGSNSLDFDVKLSDKDGQNKFTSDTVKFTGTKGTKDMTWDMGNVYIDDGDVTTDQEHKDFTSDQNILQGENGISAKFQDESFTVVFADKFYYSVTPNGQTVTITQQGLAGDDPLATANALEKTRQVKLGTNDEEKTGYHLVEKSLDEMKSGDFSVFGSQKGSTENVLSGQIISKKGEEPQENHGSFFDLGAHPQGSEEKLNLHVTDLTIKDAERKDTDENGGGSVLRNNNAGAHVDMTNLKIVDNSSTSTNGDETKGGAIYNNGGKEKEGAGLYLSQVEFSGNTAKGENGKEGKGGAVYNDSDGVAYFDGVTTTARAAEPEPATKRVTRSAEPDESSLKAGQNDIYNKGKIYTSGKNDFGTLFTNDTGGEVTFKGEDKLAKFVNSATATFAGNDEVTALENQSNAHLKNQGNLTLQSVTNNDGEISNEDGVLTFAGKAEGNGKVKNSAGLVLAKDSDVSNLKGDFTQESGKTTVEGKFFGGKSTVTGGTFVWNTDETTLGSSEFSVSGADTVFDLAENKKLTLGAKAKVDSQVNVLSGSTLTVGGESKSKETGEGKAQLTLKEGSHWDGTIEVKDDGEFTVSATSATQTDKSVLKAEGGSVNIGENGKLHLGNGSDIAGGVTTTIGKGAIVEIADGGKMSLNGGDTVNGTTFLNGGTLDYGDSVETNEAMQKDGENATTNTGATLQAQSGTLNLNSGTLTLASSDSFIDDPVKLNIKDSATLDLQHGAIVISDEDKWEGNIKLDGGALYYATTTNGNLTATSGNLTLLDGSTMIIGKEDEKSEGGKATSTVGKDVVVDIRVGSTLNVDDGANFTLDSSDTWHGAIKNEGGEVTLSSLTGIGGTFNQTSGTVNFNEKTNLWLDSDNFNVTSGKVGLDDSQLHFYNTSNLTFTDLSMKNGSTLGFKNGAPQKVTVDKLALEGDNNHFSFDIDLSDGESDQVEIKDVNGSNGKVDVSEFGLVGHVPNQKSVDVQLFTGSKLDNLTFSSSADQVRSALGYYDLTALDNKKGWYRATLTAYNPNVYRGQVSTIAMLYNQLGVDDMVLHHLILDHAGTVPHESNVMRTRRYNQAMREGRGANVWVKPYYDGGKLSLSEGLDVDNNSYGLIAGADMPMGTFDNGWQYVPTFYVAYNGADQSYDDVDMNQNGGQAGFMTTFMKNNFIAAANVYGGAYQNEMDVENFTDKTDGWFAGVSARAAYNAKLNTNLTLQPALFASYNMFSKQDWDSDFGDMALEADALNGYNVAPELNLIYTQNDWSVYGMLQYMFTFDQDVQGKADESDLPDIGMDGDYVQYGAGVAKIWNKALSTNFQIIGRSGSRTDVGVRLGVQYMFN